MTWAPLPKNSRAKAILGLIEGIHERSGGLLYGGPLGADRAGHVQHERQIHQAPLRFTRAGDVDLVEAAEPHERRRQHGRRAVTVTTLTPVAPTTVVLKNAGSAIGSVASTWSRKIPPGSSHGKIFAASPLGFPVLRLRAAASAAPSTALLNWALTTYAPAVDRQPGDEAEQRQGGGHVP